MYRLRFTHLLSLDSVNIDGTLYFIKTRCRVFLSKPLRDEEAWSFAVARLQIQPTQWARGEVSTGFAGRGGDVNPNSMFRSRTRVNGVAGTK
jgi:hypothetical protein